MKKTTTTSVFVTVIVAILLAILVGVVLSWAKGPEKLGRISLVASAAEIEQTETLAKKTPDGSSVGKASPGSQEGYSESEGSSTSTGKSSEEQTSIPEPGEIDGTTGKAVKSVEKISESTFTINGKEVYSVTYKITFTDGTSCVRGTSSAGISSGDFNFDVPESDNSDSLSGLRKLSTMLIRSLDTIQKRMAALLKADIFM